MRHEDVTIMDVIKSLPFIFVIGMISAFWTGGFAYLILKIGTQQS